MTSFQPSEGTWKFSFSSIYLVLSGLPKSLFILEAFEKVGRICIWNWSCMWVKDLSLESYSSAARKSQKILLSCHTFFQDIEIISSAQLIFVKSQKRTSRFIKFHGQYWEGYSMTSNASSSYISFFREIIWKSFGSLKRDQRFSRVNRKYFVKSLRQKNIVAIS